MLPLPKPRRKPSARQALTFLRPLWDDDHPAMRRIDPTLPHDHHARWLVRVVALLDLTDARRDYAGYGSLAYPVELLLPFVLFMYSKGLLSPAEWARQARYDDQSKWLLRGLQPSRSQLYAFRDRVEPFLDDWHRQLLAWAIAQGLTAACRGSLDGTFVAALASRHQLCSCRRVDRRLLLLRLLVWLDGAPGQAEGGPQLGDLPQWLLLTALLWLALLSQGVPPPSLLALLLNLLSVLELLHPEPTPSWQPQLPHWVPASVAGRRRVLARYQDAQQRLARRLEPIRRKPKLSKKDRETLKRLKVSLTDPEAALGWDKLQTYRPLYNVPLLQASDAPLTLAFDVLGQSNDEGLLRPLLEKAATQVGRPLKEVLIDGGFVSVGEVLWCEGQDILVYAPPSQAAAAQAAVAQACGDPVEGGTPAGAPSAPAAAASTGAEKFPKSAFRYDSVAGVYYCPQGKRLEATSHTTVKRSNGLELPMVVHAAKASDCRACPDRPRCTGSPQGRTVKRYVGEEALERLTQRMAEPANQAVYKLRSRTVELGYADIKQHRGLRVFRCFGRKRARAQAGLVILASNGLNGLRLLHRRQSSDPPSSSQEEQVA
jgi:transposase